MAVEKVLHKIQSQINELAPMLELFVEDTIQPTVEDCERLQKQMVLLQEYLAVYKFQKLNKEISPSFNIHAKISEVTPAEPPVSSAQLPTDTLVKAHLELEMEPSLSEGQKTGAPTITKNISIGINDKFRFINELFSRNSSEYNIALEQLNTVDTWKDAEVYLNSLKSLYQWKEQDEVAKLFFLQVKKRFE